MKLEGIPDQYQIFIAVFFVLMGVINTAVMWFKGRNQRRENPTMIETHKRVLAWNFIGSTSPFLVLFLGAEIANISILDDVFARSFDHSIYKIFVALTFSISIAFMFYIFKKNGARELVSLQGLFQVRPASWNTEVLWKSLAVLCIPMQVLGLYWIYYFSTHFLLPVGG